MEILVIATVLAVGIAGGMYIASQIEKRVVKNIQKGDTGEQGPEGPEGHTGQQGPQGLPGERGSVGEQGERGLTGETGRPGQDATASNTSIQEINKRIDKLDDAMYEINKHIGMILDAKPSSSIIEEEEDENLEKNRLGGGVRNWKRIE
jgi:hypothetical protein